MLLTIEYSVSLSEIIAVIVTILAASLGYIIKQQREKIKEINSQLSEHKYAMYNEVLNMVFDLIRESKGGITTDNLGIRILNMKQQMLIYAPDNVFKKFLEWTRYTANHESGDLRHFLIYLDLMILIRKDMGHPKTSFVPNDFWKLIMTTDEEIEMMKQKIESQK
jgi:hypothetical protein